MSPSWRSFIGSSLSLFLLMLNSAWSAPLGASFSYQGKLIDASNPASGAYDLSFKLFDKASDGAQIGSTLELPGVTVSDGIFSVELNYGSTVFNGEGRWLEVGVRPGGSADPYSTLNPRSQVLATPQSLFALQAGSLLNGSISNPSFFGTTDATPLDFFVNNQRGLRLEPGTSPNVIGGAGLNFVLPGVIGATIGGGGAGNFLDEALPNQITGNFGTIGGGLGNLVGGDNSFIGGGMNNFVAPGTDSAVIGGGQNNTNNTSFSTIAGGSLNLALYEYTTIGGGGGNLVYGLASTISGGYQNSVFGNFAMVPGGAGNRAWGDYSFAAGNNAKAEHAGAFVWADSDETPFSSSANNQFAVRAAGGARYETGGAGLKVDGAFAATSDEKLVLIRGVINGDGTISSGSGFGVSSPSPGRYDVSFTKPFSSAPVVTLSAHNDPGSPVRGVNINTADGGVTGSVFRVFASEGAAAVSSSVTFEFIAVGTR